MLKKVRILAVISALGLSMACKGPEGPMGPAGPQGDPGPGTRVTFSGQLDSRGEAAVQLPAEAGSLSAPPAVSCFISSSAAGAFLQVSTDLYSGISCGLVSGSGGLRVGLIGAPAYWYYRVAVVY